MSTKTYTVGEAFSPPKRGKSGLSKTYIKDNPGQYAVYSAATTGPLGYIDTHSHSGPALSWSTNGYAGNIMVLDGEYSLTADRALVTPIIDGLNLDYCRLALQAKFRDAARGRRIDGKKNEYTKLTAELVRNIEFEVPIGPDGLPDQGAQEAHVARYARIAELQARAREYSKLIAGALPKSSMRGQATEAVALMDEKRFQFIRKETSWGKKDWHTLATGDESDYPVYSAARGPVAFVSVQTPKLIEASEESKVVSFAVDGDSSAGGNLVLHTRPFYVSTNRACFTTSDPSIDLDYVYHSLATMKSDHGFSFAYKAYKGHLTDVVVDFPVAASGQLDFQAQRDAAARRTQLLKLGSNVISVLDKLAGVKVEPDGFIQA